MEEDILYSAANYYQENLMGRKFIFQAQRRDETLELELVFKDYHFKHLSGLHKLVDFPSIAKGSGANILTAILNREITYEEIKGSVYIHELSGRLECYEEMKAVLNSSSLFLKAKSDFFKSSYYDGTKENYMFTDKIAESDASCLFINRTKGETLAQPRSFFVGDSKQYQRAASVWTVLSMKEILVDGTVIVHNLDENSDKTEDAETDLVVSSV